MSQNGNLPQIGVEIKNLWNHHLARIFLDSTSGSNPTRSNISQDGAKEPERHHWVVPMQVSYRNSTPGPCQINGVFCWRNSGNGWMEILRWWKDTWIVFCNEFRETYCTDPNCPRKKEALNLTLGEACWDEISYFVVETWNKQINVMLWSYLSNVIL